MTATTLNNQEPSARTSSHRKVLLMTTTALFAALICISTAYLFHIPVGVNGGYIHIGDSLIYLAAALLPAPYAMAAGALGGMFADLLTAPVWAPATFIIKMLITLPLTSKKEKLVNTRNVVGAFFAGAISILGYYLAEVIMFGTWAALIPSVAGNLVQAIASAVIFVLFGMALDKTGFKKKI